MPLWSSSSSSSSSSRESGMPSLSSSSSWTSGIPSLSSSSSRWSWNKYDLWGGLAQVFSMSWNSLTDRAASSSACLANLHTNLSEARTFAADELLSLSLSFHNTTALIIARDKTRACSSLAVAYLGWQYWLKILMTELQKVKPEWILFGIRFMNVFKMYYSNSG